MTISVILVVFFVLKTSAIWPPPHEIKLYDAENFVISELWDDDEEEMIPPPEIDTGDDRKYFKIDQLARHVNTRETEKKRQAQLKKMKKIKEFNFDLDEGIPWEGGFVDKERNFIQQDNENVYYLNELAKSVIDNKLNEKRENIDENKNDENENYDYKSFKNEYEAEVAKYKKESDTFNYTDVKEGESVSEAVDAISDFKNPKNCTAEENKGIGLAAVKCLVKDFKTSKSKNTTLNVVEKIVKIALIWLCVYVIIAIPCWCQRGWCCCCCCCCKICRPRDVIEDAKRFYTQNPVGTYHTKDGLVEYEPTKYEIYTQKSLERAIFNL